MSHRANLALLPLLAALLISACTRTDTYPLTGAPCGPDDPVKTLEGADCVVAPTGTGTF